MLQRFANVKRSKLGCTVLVLSALAILGGCGKGDEKKAATQVAAKVNSEEISVHQINGLLERAERVSPEDAPKLRRQILDKLIDQQLAVQQALEKRLDRTPRVMAAIESARMEIIARAYLEQVAEATPKATAAEVSAFYAEHPQLFAQRRIYNVQEIGLPGDEASLAEVKNLVEQGKSISDIAAALKAKGIRFSADAGVRAAEQLPLDMLPRYHAMKDGQTQILESPRRIVVSHLVASQSQPIDEAAAVPRVQAFLANQRAGEAVVKDIKQLREKAQIEMLGEFAQSTPVATNAPVEVVPPVKPASPAALDDAAVKQGVAGLK